MVTKEHKKEVRRLWEIKNREKILKRKRDWANKWRKLNPEELKKRSLNNYYKFKDKRNKYSSEYYHEHKKDPHYIELRRIRTLESYYRNKDKASARRKVSTEIRAGRLKRPEVCPTCHKKTRIEAHHHDYSKPLEIKWVCKKCHEKEHHFKCIDQLEALKAELKK